MMRYRAGLLLIVTTFYGGIFLLWGLGYEAIYENLLYGLGIIPFRFPFVDTHGVLAPAQCYHAGIAIYPINPCDVLQRPVPYSPLWLDLIPAGMTTDDTPALGIAFILAFLAGLAAVLRPASSRELALMAIASISTCVTFAIERGNADLLLFGLAAATAVLYGGGSRARLGAYALAFAGGTLKFYSFVLLALALRERPGRFLAIAGTALLGLVAFGAYYYRGILEALDVMPSGSYFGDAFSAWNLPFGIVDLAGLGDAAGWAIFAALVAASIAGATLLAGRFLSARVTIDWAALEIRSLLVGSLVIVGCFFAGESVGYRGIFLLLAIPGLLRLRRDAADKDLTALPRLAIAAVLCLMWEEGIRHGFEWTLGAIGIENKIPGIASTVFWVLRELVWWWVISELTAVIALFALQSPLAREATRVFYRAPSHGAADDQALRQRR